MLAPRTAKVAYVSAPNLAVQVERQRSTASVPLLILGPLNDRTVFATDVPGLAPGLPLYRARQIEPLALVVENDEPTYHARHNAIEAALRVFSLVIETAGLGTFYVDVRGLGRIHGQDQELAEALRAAAAQASGLSVRVGLADGKFTAEQAARFSGPACAVSPEAARDFLAPLPVAVLPGLDGEAARRLDMFDLFTLGDLVAISKPAMLRQFGAKFAALYELARGRDPRPVRPDVPPLKLVRALTFTEPVETRDILRNAAYRLVSRLRRDLVGHACQAEAIQITLTTDEGEALHHGRAAKPPTADELRLRDLVDNLLEQLQPRRPIARVSLSAYPLRPEHLSAHQVTLNEAGVSEQQTRLEEALRLLQNRFGETAVQVAIFLGPPLPLPVEVTLDRAGRPMRFKLGGLEKAVAGYDSIWRDEREWWTGRPIRRDYFRVILDDGSLRNVFQDMDTHAWFLDRAWPIL